DAAFARGREVAARAVVNVDAVTPGQVAKIGHRIIEQRLARLASVTVERDAAVSRVEVGHAPTQRDHAGIEFDPGADVAHGQPREREVGRRHLAARHLDVLVGLPPDDGTLVPARWSRVAGLLARRADGDEGAGDRGGADPGEVQRAEPGAGRAVRRATQRLVAYDL